MLLKLLKYDFRAMWKSFSLIWGAALVLALVNRFTLHGQYASSMMGETASGLMLFVLIAALTAMFVISLVFIIQRFQKGLLGDEGYLMHTLPVRAWQLVASKLICAVVTEAVSILAAILAFFIMADLNWSELLRLRMWWELLRAILKSPHTMVLIGEFCLLILSFLVVNIAILYMAMSVGHLFARRRRLLSVAAFIGLYVLLFNVYGRFFSLHVVRQLMGAATGNIYGSMLTASLLMLVPAAALLAGVSWILENKLNLE